MSDDLSRINITIQDKAIQLLAKDNLALKLVFIKQNENDYNTSYITTDVTSAEDIRKSCQEFIKERKKWTSFEYGEHPDNEKTIGVFRTITVADIPYKNEVLKNPTILENHLTKELMDSTKWIGFRFEAKDKSILFFKKIASNWFVFKEHGKFHMVRGGVATLFHENLVKFPDDFDLVKFGDSILIFNPIQFEELFHYHVLHEKVRKEIFDHFRKKSDFEIENLDDIEDIVKNDKRMLRKFGPIKDKQIYNKKLAEIKGALRVRKVITLKITGNKLKFKGSRAFVDFFNDNHLSSHFTKKNYTSHSKTEET